MSKSSVGSKVADWKRECGRSLGGRQGRKPLGTSKRNFFRFDLEMEEPRAPAAFVQRLGRGKTEASAE